MARPREPKAANSEGNSPKPKRRLPEALERNKFKPGHSGNPSGRPKSRTLTAALRALLEEEDPRRLRTRAEALARKIVAQALKGDIRAATLIGDRTEGKPPQAVSAEHSFDPNAPLRVVIEHIGAKA